MGDNIFKILHCLHKRELYMIVTFTIDSGDKNHLYQLFSEIKFNPYKDYISFKNSVSDIINENKISDDLLKIFNEIKYNRENDIEKSFLIKNCPIDTNIPIFDHSDPVNDKYIKKKTFISESFLELFSQLTDNPLLAYDTRNNGDFFHDVYAQDKYGDTQTQKSDSELYLHNDRTAHPVRADYLSLLGMRSCSENDILTSYIDGKDVLEHISEEYQAILRKPYFYTPYDEYSRDSNKNQVDSEPHAILSERYSLRYYETRTIPIQNSPSEVSDAYISFRNAIIKSKKKSVDIQVGDLFTFPNQFGLHSRTFINIRNKDLAKKRWLLKTYSFRNTEYMKKFSKTFDGINGAVIDSLAFEQE